MKSHRDSDFCISVLLLEADLYFQLSELGGLNWQVFEELTHFGSIDFREKGSAQSVLDERIGDLSLIQKTNRCHCLKIGDEKAFLGTDPKE